jgi:multicomponent Na+:H+ antiporter subunit E
MLHAICDSVSMTPSGFITRLLVFSALWLLLAGGAMNSLIVGVVFIVAASLLSLYLLPPQRHAMRSFKGSTKVLSFVCYFSVQSLRAGWDIAKLALMPGSKTAPGFVKYRSELMNDSQIFTFMQVLNLLPGTVCAGREGSEIIIHVLDNPSFSQSDVDDCQRRVTQLL